MARSRSFTVPPDADGVRLDALLAEQGCYASRSAAVKAIETNRVFVNGTRESKKHPVCAGDTIVYEDLPSASRPPIEGEDIPLDIRYEDDKLIVLSKQTGLCVHPSPGHYGSTLCHALVHRYGREGLAHIQGDDRPGIVHRLDMETSGLLVCAKTEEAGNLLQDMIRRRTVDRRYLALVHGNIAHDTGMVDASVARGWSDRLRMVVTDRGNAREAITTFTVLERFEAMGKDNGFTLLECKLYTGRTHQIRVHMEYIGHCCVGDPLYSWGPDEAQLGLHKRQFLHSYSLGLTHPYTNEKIELTDGLPPDLAHAYELITPRSLGKSPDGARILEELKSAPAQSDLIQLS
ncbi:MAG: RluA family pseudouridine synthase [Eggerthellaceae bacterium]|nr:RluA family pseudouridine synthase [Eggerthellaceae bacterium]